MPEVPNVVRNAPHLSILADFFRLLERSGAGRKTQDDRPPVFAKRNCVPKSVTDKANFVSLVGMVRDAIHFHEIHAPDGELLRERIVVRLSGGFGRVESKVERIPRASVGGIRGIRSVKLSSGDR